MKKRFLAMVMAVVMAMSLLPVSAFAADATESGGTDVTTNQIVSDGQVVTPDQSSGKVKHSKTITQTGENSFDITLKVQTKEEITSYDISPDAAVVLVLDVSNSMTASDITSAKTAATNFIKKFKENAGDAERKVAIVEFGSNAKTVLGWTEANSTETAGTISSAISSIQNKFQYTRPSCNTSGTHTHWERGSVNDINKIEYRNYNGDWWNGWYCTVCNSRVSSNAFNNKPNDATHDCWVEKTYEGPHGEETKTDNGGTNIEGALRLANNLLSAGQASGGAINDIENLFVVMMTDGVPTYYVADSDESNSTTFMEGTRGGGDKANHSDYHDVYCTKDNHTSGDNVPKQIKDQGAKLYTVSYKSDNVTEEVNGQSIDQWLASFATQTFKAGDNIETGLENIAQVIVNQAKAWILTDPMGTNINFGENSTIARVDENESSSDAVKKYNTDTKTLTWDLKNDAQRTGPDSDGWYTYTLTYSVTLDTLASGFSASSNYETNGITTLTYMLSDDKGNLQPTLYSTNLTVPQVKGFAGDLSFTKVDAKGTSLAGATFTLTTADDDTWKKEATSDESGNVKFEGIPSGHTYTLKETSAPANYVKSDKEYTVEVSYGTVTVKDGETTISDLSVTNTFAPKPVTLTVTKAWSGSDAPNTLTSVSAKLMRIVGNDDRTSDETDDAVIDADIAITKSESGAWTATVNNLPSVDTQTGEAYTYYLVETTTIENFTASGGDVTIANGAATATITNTYQDPEPDPDPTGSLTVTKTVSGADLPSNFKITVSGPNNYSQDLTLTGKTKDSDNAYTWTINNLTPGSYTVSENNATVAGYALTATTNYGENAQSANVTAGGNASVSITNTYSQVFGSLTINKVDSVNENTKLSGAEFTLTKSGAENAAYTATSGTDGKATFDSIALGTYTLTETKAPEGYTATTDTYTVKVEQDTTDTSKANVTVTKGTETITLDNGAMTITNTKESNPPVDPDPTPTTGTLKITKKVVVTGNNSDDFSRNIFTIYIKAEESLSDSVNGKTFGEAEFTNGTASVSMMGDQSCTITGLPLGTYTITEGNSDYPGYTLTTTYSNNGQVTLSETTSSAEVTVTNAYTYSPDPVIVPGDDQNPPQEGGEKVTGQLKVSKSYNNWKDGDEFTFTLTAKDNAPLPVTTGTSGNTNGGDSITVVNSVSIKADKDHQTVAFGDITFTKAGEYEYTVSEVKGSITGVTYDKTEYTVVITVTDTGAGELGYEVNYFIGEEEYNYNDAMPFTNTYSSGSSNNNGGGSHKPTLNTKDHYGYIIGYPVDYETGEKTTDQTRMPVKPQGNITRAEVATIFFRMLTDDSRNEFWSTTNAYSDVSEGQWFNNAISTLANAGILSGYPDGTFRPNAPITRAEFTKIAASFFEKVEYTMANPFNDVDEDDWFYAFVMAAYEGGLITGYPEGDFRPTANITRAEAVTIVNRTLDRHPDQDHFLKDMLVWPDNMDTSKWYYADMQEATNSHEYVMKGSGDSKYENWTKMLEIRDWAAFEKAWSDANSATGGEVAK